MEIGAQFQSYTRKFAETFEITCFTISNTSKRIGRYYFTPVRAFENIQIGGVVVSNSIEAREFAKLADGKFDYIAVDSEKKIEAFRYAYPDDLGNIEGEILNTLQHSEVIGFKANDVTVNAVDVFVSEKMMGIPARRIAVVGSGNIGFKLGLKFVERGSWARMHRRNQEKLRVQVECINLTKPIGTLAEATSCSSLEECLEGAHAVIAVADSSNIISLDDLKHASRNPLLIDCGKFCFGDDVCAARDVYRTDVGMALMHQLKLIIASQSVLHSRFGRVRVEGKTYVCGVSGLKGDIVLRDINDLESVVGICDGEGGLVQI